MRGRPAKFAVKVILGFAPLLSACSPSLKEVCSREIPRFTAELAEKRTQVASIMSEKANRGIASVTPDEELVDPGNGQLVTPEEAKRRAQVQDWVASRLTRMQAAMDRAEEEDLYLAKEKIMALTNTLVGIYGYSQLGKWDRVDHLLEQVEKLTQESQKLACGQG